MLGGDPDEAGNDLFRIDHFSDDLFTVNAVQQAQNSRMFICNHADVIENTLKSSVFDGYHQKISPARFFRCSDIRMVSFSLDVETFCLQTRFPSA